MPAASMRVTETLASIDPTVWNELARKLPLLSHAFLHALHETGCASPATGWAPQYLTAWENDRLVGAMPLYAKDNSYGEYIFDWAWADAYRRHGRRYYPKLVAAIPFTPTTGPRILGRDSKTRQQLLDAALALLDDPMFSSLHILFPQADEIALCAARGMTTRASLQFHWTNPGYRDFDAFLASMNHDKRKKIRQERRRLADQGIVFERLVGEQIRQRHWDFLYRCYANTYRMHHSSPYLSLEFFERIGAEMPENLLLVIGSRAGRPICAAFDVFNATTLWGRYWGTTGYVPGLHFEACYYQAIEFCIEQRIALFEGGAQGTHKLARGLLPVTTHSAHAIADPQFARAIADFVERERKDVANVVDELEQASPFKNEEAGAQPRQDENGISIASDP